MRLFLALLLLALAPRVASAQCSVTNSMPQFTLGGNAFGATMPQWKAFFAAKVDANNGALCGATITQLPAPINPGDAATKQYVDNLTTPIFLHPPVALATNGSASFTGSISGTMLTVSNVTAGAVGPNQALTSTSAGVVSAGTRIVSGSGTSWVVNNSQSVGSATMTSVASLPANTYSNGTGGVGATLTGQANGALSIDGTAVTAGTRVLVKDELSQANNGAYVVTRTGSVSATYLLTRATDYNTGTCVISGPTCVTPNSYFLVLGGQNEIASGWIMITQGAITVGVSPLVFQEFSAANPGLGYTPLNPVNNLTDVSSIVTSLLNLGGRTVDVQDYGATCNSSDSSTAVQNAINALAGKAIISISCPITIANTVSLPNFTHLQGAGSMFYPGMLATGGGTPQTLTWPPTAGPAINCTGTSSSCLLVDGLGIEVDHLNLGNPQITPTTGTYSPTLYPFIISTAVGSNWSGLQLHDLTFTSASQCVDLEGSSNYGTAGVVGTEWSVHDLWMNPCLNMGIKEHDIDNTGYVYNIHYAYWWNRANLSLQSYMKSNSIGILWQYAANTTLHDIEFFFNKIAIDQQNDTVSGGFNAIFAANAIAITNVSANEVCQFMGNESGTALVSTGRAANVVIYQDTTQTPYCALNSPAAIDLSSAFGANWMMANVQVGSVQTLAAVGQGSTLHLDGLDVQSYSAFASGAPAFKVSSTADLTLTNTLPIAIRAAAGAGNLIGPNVDAAFTGSISGTLLNVSAVSNGTLAVGQTIVGTSVISNTVINSFASGSGGTGTYNVSVSQSVGSESMTGTTHGWQTPVTVGGGTNASEGSVSLQGSQGVSGNTGAVVFKDSAGTQQGFINANGGKLFFSPRSGMSTVSLGTDGSNNNLLDLTPLPTTPPTPPGIGALCVDSVGFVYVKLGSPAQCP